MIPESSPWQTHESLVVYDNPWIRVREDRVTTPAGTPGRYGVVSMKHLALGVVVVDETLHTWLVGQWRYTLNAWSWEIPEGGGTAQEPPLSAIQRELREETGLEAAEWTFLMEIHTSNSVTDESAKLYLARHPRLAGAPCPEETEALMVRRLPLAEAVAMVHRGEITDALSVAALLRVAALPEFMPGYPTAPAAAAG